MSDAINHESIVAAQGPRRNYFLRHWRGELSLAVSYWVNGFLANIAGLTLVAVLGVWINSLQTDYAPAIYWVSAWLVIFLIATWQSVGIWRSADRSKQLYGKASNGSLAKFMVVVGIISIVSRFGNEGIPAIKESFDRIPIEKWQMKIVRDGSELEVSGGIGNGFTNDLTHILDIDPGIKLVHVNIEHGGLLREAHDAGDVIRRRELDTYVSTTCQSACTIVFLGGRHRYLARDAKLGFHSASYPGLSDTTSLNTSEQEYLRTVGVSEGFINHVISTPPDQMWYPDILQLVQEGIVTKVISGDQFALPSAAKIPSRGDLEAYLLKTRIYQAMKIREPEGFEKLVDTLLDAIKNGKSIDDIRPVSLSYIAAAVKKYTPYADEHALIHLATVMMNEVAALHVAPEPVCAQYFIRGEGVNAAVQFLPGAIRDDELSAEADVIESADLSRQIPDAQQRDRVMNLLVRRLDKDTLREAAAMADQAYVGSYRTCVAFSRMLEGSISLPPPNRELALRTLLAGQ